MDSVTRRAVLRGLGVSMALPWLESLQPRAAHAEQTGKPPVRFGCLYFANGVHPQAWTPAGAGSDFQLSEILTPLAPVKSDILVLTELMNMTLRQVQLSGPGSVNHQMNVQIEASTTSTYMPAAPIAARCQRLGSIHESDTLQYRHGVSTRNMTPIS